MKLLIFPPIDTERLRRIAGVAAEIGGSAVNAANEAEALREIVDSDAFFGRVSAALLSRAGRLRWIQAPTASLEHYLFPELVAHPATLTNMRGLFNDCIADQVLGYITCFARNLHLYIRRQKSGQWAPIGDESSRVEFQYGAGKQTPIDRAHRQLTGATLGVVGLGGIGAEIARRGLACHMDVIAVDPLVTTPLPGMRAVWPVRQLHELLAASDYVVIAAPHTPETAGWFGREQFAQMRSSAYLINIGRGAIVRLADLTAALQEGVIAGAALDVCETEPLPAEHPLWQMDNVIITPHVAGMAPQIAERHLCVLLDNMRRFASGKSLLNVVDKHKWY